jgi:HUS1 checkpoint protein
MRFKATISLDGLMALERRYLPTLEKFGKRCAVLLSPSEVYLVQDAHEADGMQISASLSAVSSAPETVQK